MDKKKKIYAADLFCGAGGTSQGLLMAANEMDADLELIAINHWNVAIDTHSINHPYAKHLCTGLDQVDPRKLVPGGRLHVLCASPECTHHSVARSGKPMPHHGGFAVNDFQNEVGLWVDRCFGPAVAADKTERNHRFLEESLELVQACGCTEDEAVQLVRYVFSRPVGDRFQEVGGVCVTLAALCNAQGIDADEAARVELDRVWGRIEQIRAKQATKLKGSPLPGVCA